MSADADDGAVDGTDPRECDRGDCDDLAVAVYEGIDPPAATVRYAACGECAPDDVPPVEVLLEGAADACICGHTRADHRHRRGNQHTTWTTLDDCRADGCDCPGFGRWVETTDDDSDADDGDEAGRKVECTVCGALVGRGPNGLGIKKHAGKHRREFRERFDREPDDYAEVRERLGRPSYQILDDDSQMTLYEATDTRARDARNDDQQADLVNPDQLNPVDDTDADGGRE